MVGFGVGARYQEDELALHAKLSAHDDEHDDDDGDDDDDDDGILLFAHVFSFLHFP